MRQRQNEIQMLKLGRWWLTGVSLKSLTGIKTRVSIFELFIEKYNFIPKEIGIGRGKYSIGV